MTITILYQIGGILAIILIGYKLYKEISPGKDILQILGCIILLGWFYYFLEFQYPDKLKDHDDLINKYGWATFPVLDKIQEDDLLYRVSDYTKRVIPPTVKQPILIVFPEWLADMLKWDSSEYWKRRVWYRIYPLEPYFIIQDKEGHYHNFDEKILSNRPGISKGKITLPDLNPDIVNQYTFIIFPIYEEGMMPPGFKEWRRFKNLVYAIKEHRE